MFVGVVDQKKKKKKDTCADPYIIGVFEFQNWNNLKSVYLSVPLCIILLKVSNLCCYFYARSIRHAQKVASD